MAVPKKRMVPHLWLLDPEGLFPETLLTAIQSSQLLTIDDCQDIPATAALLVIGLEEVPLRTVQYHKELLKDVPLIVYDPTPTVGRQAHVFNARAGGYVVAGTGIDDLLPVIELARLGGFGLCRLAYDRVLSGMHAPVEFSPREREVVTLMALGANNATISAEMHISEKEVEQCIQRARRKVGVESNTALATWWTHWTLNDDFAEDDDGDDDDDDPSFVISA